MSSKITVVVPTYWGRPEQEKSEHHDRVFDHPTPIDGDSTLPRLLDSLCQLDDDTPPFNVLILIGTVHPDLEPLAFQHVSELVASYPLSVGLFGADDLRRWQSHIDPQHALLGMDTYAQIRNNQLLVPHVMRSEVVIALDDDEVVESDFIKKAVQHSHAGIAGIYVDATYSPWLPETPLTGNPYIDKAHIMNNALRQLMNHADDLPKTPIAYGGNMIFRRALWEKIPFDLGITRGEDVDYVLNAKLAGIDFVLDKTLRIIHLPPHHYNTPQYVKMSEDVRRFVYEQEKLKQYGQHINNDFFMPYPGKLINASHHQILSALQQFYTEDMHDTPETVLQKAVSRAKTHVREYAAFRQNWETLMRRITDDSDLCTTLLKLWNMPITK